MKNNKNNFLIKSFLVFLVIIVSFIGFKVITSIFKHSEKISISYGSVGGYNYEKSKIVCDKEKIVRKIFEPNVGHQGYKLHIELENGKILSVDDKQFQKATEGKQCRTIF